MNGATIFDMSRCCAPSAPHTDHAYFELEKLGRDTYTPVMQRFVEYQPVDIKETTVGAVSDFQRYDHNTGLYSVVRKGRNGEVVGGYEMSLKPQGRTFATGFKGKLQKAAIKIGTDANGCERPVLRKVSGLLFDIAKKIK